MESKHEVVVKLFMDEEKKQPLYLECYYDFVDLLFSFLTLPLGTIIRLYSREDPFNLIGCMNKLYNSVRRLSVPALSTESCKRMLNGPQRASEIECSKLKLKHDYNEPTCYYVCMNHCVLSLEYGGLWSCGDETFTAATLKTSSFADDGAFVKGGFGMIYIITDDLQVT
ncbi:hypothetical protein GIB67_007604 [Kingdonia uniflora]|uniref:Uncharacterized protein n=1 Tax=Kingdonia uniflora TaxID=39325 RepID=A0A7J7N1F7_9MAGN|nr:hypothetical protein GIB67_007604 [Kingdonia uniflora]